MPYVTDGGYIALPGGGTVTVAFLAQQGVPGYQARPDGSYVVPDDATFRAFGGTEVPVAQYGYASPLTQQQQTPKPPTDTSGQADAFARLRQILADYDLNDLAGEVESWVRGGISANEAILRLYEHPRFKAEFPEIDQRRQRGLAPLSPGEIITYRRQARQLFRAAGLPEGFYDGKEDFQKFLINDVSLAELQDRVNEGYVRVMQAPAEVRGELERLYGVGSGALAAFFLDEQRALPVIQKQVAAAEIGGAATRTGFGQLATSEAERLADLNVTGAQATEGFNTLAASRELTVALDQGEDTISRDEQLSAVFEGNAQAGDRLSRRARRRAAGFQGGGQLATSREGGFAGLSTAS